MHNGCINTTGHLAYVATVLMCTTTYGSNGMQTDLYDGSIDQFTWFAYDDAGRLIEEYTTDDNSRAADTQYVYTANGALSEVITPNNGSINWTYGSSGNNSDSDLVTSMGYGTPNSPTTVIDTVTWNPFGPFASYNWEATIGGTKLDNKVSRNLAYRITNVYGAEKGSTENAEVDITEDLMGRVTSRVFSPTLTGLGNSYFTRDEQSRVLCEATSSGTCPTSGSTLKNNHDITGGSGADVGPFMGAGDWKEVLRPVAGSSGGTINNFNSSGSNYGISHQVTDVNQSNGTPSFGHTAFAYDARGNRTSDDNTTTFTDDQRNYTYEGIANNARHNVTNVRGQYYTGSVWHYYDVASAFDHKNRRVFKSFYDETTQKTATWFFYYDAQDRLTEVRYTPDSSVSGTYSIFDLFWLKQKLVLYWEGDYVSSSLSTTSKRYVASDETDRPIQLWNWPSSGDATRVWAINPSAWGFDTNIVGSTVFQPILFAGQYQDVETAAYQNDGATIHRPGLAVDQAREYDPFIGGYLQVDPIADKARTSYVYAESNPLGDSSDPLLAGADLGSAAQPGLRFDGEAVQNASLSTCSFLESSLHPQALSSLNDVPLSATDLGTDRIEHAVGAVDFGYGLDPACADTGVVFKSCRGGQCVKCKAEDCPSDCFICLKTCEFVNWTDCYGDLVCSIEIVGNTTSCAVSNCGPYCGAGRL